MGVNINPAWRYKQAFGINLSLARADIAANLRQHFSVNSHIADKALSTRSVNDCATANDDIMHILASSLVLQI
jgi:hypothetical protein